MRFSLEILMFSVSFCIFFFKFINTYLKIPGCLFYLVQILILTILKWYITKMIDNNENHKTCDK